MQTSRIILAAAAVLSLAFLTCQADARPRQARSAPAIDVAAIPPYPLAGQNRSGRQASRRVAAVDRHQSSAGAEQGYQRPSNAGMGLTTVSTAAGIDIKVSADFAPLAQAAIAAAVAEGIKFRRINCFDLRRTHKARSNHKTGDACDSRPSIPARIVRAAGLRSGCDFADCPHFDNARNVGGIPYWNSVRHRTRLARQ